MLVPRLLLDRSFGMINCRCKLNELLLIFSSISGWELFKYVFSSVVLAMAADYALMFKFELGTQSLTGKPTQFFSPTTSFHVNNM